VSAILGPAEETLLAAEKIAATLARAGVDSALIGAVALAAHGYARSTEDLDLATGIDPSRLDEIADELRREGFSVEVSEPDGNDPLGGVLRVSAAGIDPIEIVNFCNPPAGGFPALVEAALRDAIPFREGESLRVVTLTHLIVFKLYAGGRKAKSDVFELLNRNPDLDLNQLRDLCKRFRMSLKLERWLHELRESEDD
jgi:hypothetical protein